MKRTILIADDEKNTREGLRWALERKDLSISLAADGEQALDAIRSKPVDILITDLKMPKLDGMQLLEKVKAESPSTEVVMLTGHGTVESAVDAMKHGASDYLIKPINIDELNMLVDRILKAREMQEENAELRQKVEQRFAFENIVGRSEVMARVFAKVRTVAPTRANVLLLGESGTGKEMIANAIHMHSPRRHRPFVKVNCGALPLTLLESELFGHEKGAFTGAVKTKPGRFELADGGTILLDEIGETGPEFQVKLLRVLQEGTFERVGGTDTIKVDVRVIAATNKRLDELVKQGQFREDLYYRLKVVEIDLPPLRDRREDIPLLIDHFLEEFSAYYGKPKPPIQNRAMSLLQNAPWPGNVRQLRNVIEGAFVMTEGELTVNALPDDLRSGEEATHMVQIPAGSSLRDAEKELIQAGLIHFGGNRAKTARALGLGRKTLYRKLEEYGLE
jgi:DNA-binding NtrC family response regulator